MYLKNYPKILIKLSMVTMVITDDKGIGDTMNSFFINFGSTVEAKIPLVKWGFKWYLIDKKPRSIFLKACNQSEIAELINNFSNSKSCGPFSLPTKILKEFSQYFIEPITVIVNNSLEEGIFPQLLKNCLSLSLPMVLNQVI